MYATAATHLPHPLATVVDTALAASPGAVRWWPELHRLDDLPLDVRGARSELALGVAGRPERIRLTTERVVRTTVTASGRASDGREVSLCISLSPWDGGTAVVVSIDTGDGQRPLSSWSLTRRLETALARLAGTLSSAASARP